MFEQNQFLHWRRKLNLTERAESLIQQIRSSNGLGNKQKPRVGVVDEQRLDMNGHQLLFSEYVFSLF